MKRYLLICILFMISLFYVNGQVYNGFDKVINYGGLKVTFSILRVQSGYILAGGGWRVDPDGVYRSGIILTRLNEDGDTVWVNHVLHHQDDYFAGYFGGLIMLPDSSMAMFGNIRRSTDNKMLFYRFNAVGDTLYTRELGGSGFDSGISCRRGQNGDFYLAGYSKSFNNPAGDFYIAKLDSLGAFCWEKIIYFNKSEELSSIELDSKDNIYLGGFSESYKGSANSDGSPLVVKLDSAGNFLWHKVVYLSNDTFDLGTMAFLHYVNDNMILAGSGLKNKNSHGYSLITLLDSTGNFHWQRRMGPLNSYPALVSFAMSSDGHIIATGSTTPYGMFALQCGWIYKLSLNGDPIWERQYWNPNFDQSGQSFLNDHVVIEDGSIVGAGWGYSPQNSWILKIDSTGCLNDQYCGFVIPTAQLKEDLQPTAMGIYPNPSEGVFHIQLPQSTILSATSTSRQAKGMRLSPMEPGFMEAYYAFMHTASETSNTPLSPPEAVTETSSASPFIIRVYATDGRLKYESLLPTLQTQIDIQHLPSGMYWVQVIQDQEIFSGKLMLKTGR
jgi:hypothetical protein